MRCATCGNATTRSCRACSMVDFCSETCEKAHWAQHKDQCGDLLHKLVHRVGAVFREILYLFAECAFVTNVSNISKGEDGIVVFESTAGVQQTHQALFTFPAHMVPNLDDRHCVLSTGRSEDALGFLHDFIAQMLRGAPVFKIEEVVAQMRQSPKAHIMPRADAEGDRRVREDHHRFLKFQSTTSSKRWTLDPAGVGYGVQSPAMANLNHSNSYVADAQPMVYRFGYHKERLSKFAMITGVPGLKYRVLSIARDYLHNGLDEWKNQTQLTLPALLRLPDQQFVRQLGMLRTRVHGSMSKITTSSAYRFAIQDALK